MKITHENNIVVIGGGTGTSTIVQGLKKKPVHVAALVSVADSGGSTGRLRDEFGFQPVGDLRQSLAALAEEGSQDWIRRLLLYRFSKGKGLEGHNLGNLILTALQDMAGSTTSALEIAERVFQLHGDIYPVTSQNVQLVVEYEDGSRIVGEDNLNGHELQKKKIRRVSLQPPAKIYDRAAQAILDADLVVIGPGDHYASVMAALAVQGIQAVMKKTKAKIVYIVNLMTRANQTHGMSAADHLQGIEKTIGRRCDVVVVNSGKIDEAVLRHYETEKEYPVVNDLKKDSRCRMANLVSSAVAVAQKGDALERSLLRHDPDKMARLLMGLL